MNFKVIGAFYSHTVKEQESKKKPGEKFFAGDAIFEIDNSYEKDGQKVFKMDLVPFNVFGKTAEKVLALRSGEEMDITFQLEGREYQGKYYQNIRAPFIHHVQPVNQEKQAPKTDKDIPF